MRMLALDTTTREGSAALLDDDRVIGERLADPAKSHAEQLPGELLLLLEACRLTVRDIDRFVVASGPGSFTGLRIGIATMQGLAFVTKRPLAGVSALEALAHAASIGVPAGTTIAAWMDAQRGEVFSALYRTADAPPFDAARLVTIEEPAVARPDDTLTRWTSARNVSGAVFVGAGAVRYAEAISGRAAGVRVVGSPPLAAILGRIALRRGDTAQDPAAIRPLYIRRPDAELARDGAVRR